MHARGLVGHGALESLTLHGVFGAHRQERVAQGMDGLNGKGVVAQHEVSKGAAHARRMHGAQIATMLDGKRLTFEGELDLVGDGIKEFEVVGSEVTALDGDGQHALHACLRNERQVDDVGLLMKVGESAGTGTVFKHPVHHVLLNERVERVLAKVTLHHVDRGVAACAVGIFGIKRVGQVHGA